MATSVYLVATMDTKGTELGFVRDRLHQAGISVRTVDVGTLYPPVIQPDVPRSEVRATLDVRSDASDNHAVESTLDRGRAIADMAEAFQEFMLRELALGKVAGVLGLGGSGGTSLITTAMRALPIGLPKLMVSTVASGNVAPYIDCSDITMMYSVVDVAGLNVVSEVILTNAANAMAGMVSGGQVSHPSQGLSNAGAQPVRIDARRRQALGMTMFGVTTPCVDQVRQRLEEQGYDCLVFHATGSGGRAMEQLVASGLISGVLDITTTEVADEIAGGVFPCGPHRFEKLIQAQIPLVLSLGAMDMVNFGSRETVPNHYRQRLHHVHNAQVTLMRTNVEENRKIAAFIVEKINRSTAPVRLLIPEGGVSLLDAPGQPFYDPEADEVLFSELERGLHITAQRQLVRLPYHINAVEFSQALVEHFLELV